MADDGVRFVDAEQYRGNVEEKLTFKMIVLEHLRKIGGYASVEFRGGYWEERHVISPTHTDIIKTYIPDTREIYTNAIEYLYDLLYPHFDKKMLEDGKKYTLLVSQAYQSNTILKEKDKEGRTEAEDRIFKDVHDRITFRSIKRDLARELFRDLSCFLHRMKYMEGKTFSEEI